MSAIKTKNNSARMEELLHLFSKENPEIRKALAWALPSYNLLLEVHAKSFEEFALLPIARQQGLDYTDPLFSFRTVMPPCPRCSGTKVNRVKENTYRCRDCNIKFTATHNSIISGSNTNSLTWMQVLHCMLSFFSIKRTCEICGIAAQTYYYIRNRLFYAMQFMLQNVKLYGVVQCDNTFIHTNFKGASLEDDDYPEDSPVNKVTFIPRVARKRGGGYSHKENVTNAVCLYTAIDNYGHSLVRYVGLGNATATKLYRAVPNSKYLDIIPEKDPFEFTFRSAVANEKMNKTILISDKEKAIYKYASYLGIECQQRAYRKNSVQLQISSNEYNIQKVNALHRRLKEFFRKTNYISSKYLPGILVLFEFIENTGATTEAIGRLFEILATPNLGQAPDFYNNLFVAPNYFVEWQRDGSLLKNIPYNQMLAAYLYHKKKIDPSAEISLDYIMEQTGYRTENTIRRIYKNIIASDIMDNIYSAMEDKTMKTSRRLVPVELYISGSLKRFLELYDALFRHLSLPLDEQMPYPEARNCMMKELHITDSIQKAEKHLKQIDEYIRAKRLSEKKAVVAKARRERTQNRKLDKGIELYNRILASRAEYRSENIAPPSMLEYYKIFSEEEGVSYQTIETWVSKAKQHLIHQKLKKVERSKQ